MDMAGLLNEDEVDLMWYFIRLNNTISSCTGLSQYHLLQSNVVVGGTRTHPSRCVR